MTPPVVLIVDDDARNREARTDVLRAAGFGTLEAANGEDAIALAREQLPRSRADGHPPPRPGRHRSLAVPEGRACTARIPVVALTAHRRRARSCSSTPASPATIEKPIDVQELPGSGPPLFARPAALPRTGC